MRLTLSLVPLLIKIEALDKTTWWGTGFLVEKRKLERVPNKYKIIDSSSVDQIRMTRSMNIEAALTEDLHPTIPPNQDAYLQQENWDGGAEPVFLITNRHNFEKGNTIFIYFRGEKEYECVEQELNSEGKKKWSCIPKPDSLNGNNWPDVAALPLYPYTKPTRIVQRQFMASRLDMLTQEELQMRQAMVNDVVKCAGFPFLHEDCPPLVSLAISYLLVSTQKTQKKTKKQKRKRKRKRERKRKVK